MNLPQRPLGPGLFRPEQHRGLDDGKQLSRHILRNDARTRHVRAGVMFEQRPAASLTRVITELVAALAHNYVRSSRSQRIKRFPRHRARAAR